MPVAQGQVGPQTNQDGSSPIQGFRQGKQGDVIVSELHGRFYEQTYRGNVYMGGISNTALASTNAIATGVTATATPVIGVWNPSTSLVNLVLLKAIASLTTVANTAVSPAGFMWLVNSAQNAITTGSTPINCKTLTAAGSQAKFFPMNVALTGMTGSLTVARASSIATINAAGAATAVTLTVSPSEEYLDGSIIVPPGGVVALMNQASTTTCSLSVGIVWEEVPV